MNREELEKKAATLKWFHAINFGDFCSSGRYAEGRRQNTSLFPVFELLRGVNFNGSEVLDIGSACGLLSFGMLGLGAKSVAATDIVKFETLPLAAELLDYDIDYHPWVRADRVASEFRGRTFDCIACPGVLYHMFNPMGAIAEARLLLRKGGLIIVESFYTPEEKEPVMKFNPELNEPFKEAYTYWLISESAIAGMLKTLGFNILRRVRLSSPPRIAFLAQAVDYDEVENRTELQTRIHEIGYGEHFYRPKEWSTELANISFTPSLPDLTISATTYKTEFPHHVDFVSNGTGSSIYNPQQANF
jgi:SAM-dependent methyltransferase